MHSLISQQRYVEDVTDLISIAPAGLLIMSVSFFFMITQLRWNFSFMIREKMAFVNMKFVEGNPSEHGSWVY